MKYIILLLISLFFSIYPLNQIASEELTAIIQEYDEWRNVFVERSIDVSWYDHYSIYEICQLKKLPRFDLEKQHVLAICNPEPNGDRVFRFSNFELEVEEDLRFLYRRVFPLRYKKGKKHKPVYSTIRFYIRDKDPE